MLLHVQSKIKIFWVFRYILMNIKSKRGGQAKYTHANKRTGSQG